MNETYNFAYRKLVELVREYKYNEVPSELLRTWALVVLALKEPA